MDLVAYGVVLSCRLITLCCYSAIIKIELIATLYVMLQVRHTMHIAVNCYALAQNPGMENIYNMSLYIKNIVYVELNIAYI